MFRTYLIIILTFALSACGAKHTFVRSTPDYEHKLRTAKIAVLITPEVEVNTIDAFGKKDRQYDYEDRLENNIIETLIPQLEDKGFNAKVQALSRKEVKEYQLSSSILKIKDSFNDVIKELYTNDGAWPEEKAFSVDKRVEGAIEFHDKLNADLLIMVSLYSESKTSGAMTAEVAKHVLLSAVGIRGNLDEMEKTRAKIAVIDSMTGKILWTNSIGSKSNIFSTSYDSFSDADKVDKERLTHLFDLALVDLFGQTIKSK